MTAPAKKRSAPTRASGADAQDSDAPVPASHRLRDLARAAAGCRACPLWKLGTQTVFGQGPQKARAILVGEQPGDRENRAGAPFVGPAGALLDRALLEAGIDRAAVYVTNAVKHFKWEPRGPRRIHKKPGAREIAACRPWLRAEVESLHPALLVCLGATATQAVFGKPLRILAQRGQVLETPLGPPALITVHPASLLRTADRAQAEDGFRRLVADLRKMRRFLPSAR